MCADKSGNICTYDGSSVFACACKNPLEMYNGVHILSAVLYITVLTCEEVSRL